MAGLMILAFKARKLDTIRWSLHAPKAHEAVLRLAVMVEMVVPAVPAEGAVPEVVGVKL